MDENKNEREQNQEQNQKSQPKKANPKKSKAKEVITFVCLGIAVACVIALVVLVNINT